MISVAGGAFFIPALQMFLTEVTEYVLSRVPLCGMGVACPCTTVFARMVSAACSNGAVHLNQHLGGGDVVNVLVDEVTAPYIYSSVSGEVGGYCVTLLGLETVWGGGRDGRCYGQLPFANSGWGAALLFSP